MMTIFRGLGGFSLGRQIAVQIELKYTCPEPPSKVQALGRSGEFTGLIVRGFKGVRDVEGSGVWKFTHRE